MKKIILLTLMLLLSENIYSRDAVILITDKGIITEFPEVNYKRVILGLSQKTSENNQKTSENKKILNGNQIINNMLTEKTFLKNKNDLLTILNYDPPFVPFGKKKYTYKNQLIDEKEMYAIMLQENDPELHLIIKKAKATKEMQYAGFAAIPILVFSFSALTASAMSVNRTGPQPDSMYLTVSAIGGGAAIAVGVTGIVFSIRHTKLKTRAVKRYNQNF